jgi:raffinose/stachyose/melibiose transport system substrate-binding protein
MYYGGTWEIPSLRQSVKTFTWGVFPFPRMDDTPGTPRHGGGADNGICLSSTVPADHVGAAMRFVEYLTRPAVATLYLEPEQPLATSIKGVPVTDAPYAEVLRAEAFPNTIKFLDWIWPAEVSSAVASAIAGVVGGELTPEAASAAVQKTYDDLVARGAWPPK